ncbi:MAG TPA: DUF4136 domain-containing protein [Candidatus Aquilonibacter sp.]|nr:DUF4136 domain-containing protein [Candidatus Aquilonibacter sp.]
MKLQIRFLLSFAVLLVLTSVAFSREIKVDYDHHANFSQYKTYTWGKVETQNPLWDDRIKEAVDQELAKKGWTEVASGGDVTVMAIGTTRDQPTLQTFYDGFPGWRWGGFGEATTLVEHYEVGTLIIDIFDSRDKQLIWRGSASDTLPDKPDKAIKDLQKAVDKMFDHFPPST